MPVADIDVPQIHPVIFPAEVGFRPSPYRVADRPFPGSGTARTIFQETVLRDIADEGLAAPLIVGNERDHATIGAQLRDIEDGLFHILADQAAGKTGPAAALAALWLAIKNPCALMLIEPTDHIFRSSPAFYAAVRRAARAAQRGWFVSFAVTPISPEPGRRYVSAGAAIEGCPGVSAVSQFFGELEEPKDRTAITSDRGAVSAESLDERAADTRSRRRSFGGFAEAEPMRHKDSEALLWNSGILLVEAWHCINALTRAQPAMMQACRDALAQGSLHGNCLRPDREIFQSAPSLSLHRALLADSGRAAVVRIDMEWRDVGLRLPPREMQVRSGDHAWN